MGDAGVEQWIREVLGVTAESRSSWTGMGRPRGSVTILQHFMDLLIGRIGQQFVWGHPKRFGNDYNLKVRDFPVPALNLGDAGTVDGHFFQLEGSGKPLLCPPGVHLHTELFDSTPGDV